MHHPRHLIAAALAGLLVLSLASPAPRPAEAASIVVTNLLDDTAIDGGCSLREAMQNAENDAATNPDCTAGSGADTITFAVSGTIPLVATLPTIATTMTINGTGRSVTLDGGNAVQILTVSGNATLRRLTFTRGSGLFVGGLWINPGGTAMIADSTFSGNTAPLFGVAGAIFNQAGGTLAVANTTFTGNSSAQAGAVRSDATTTIVNSTFTGNSGGGGSGAILSNSGTTTIVGSTISGQTAGGGISRGNGGIVVSNTIIAGNPGGDCTPGGFPAVVSQGHNLVQVVGVGTNCDGVFTQPGDVTGQAVSLGALASNGGLTQTMAPAAGSIALAAGDDAICRGGTVNGLDQRGMARPASGQGHCDVGAYETPKISVAPVSQAEGNSGTTPFNFAVTLPGALPSGAPSTTVRWSTAAGSATAPSDYTAVPSTTLTFAAGESSKTATVNVNGDTSVEGDEAFTVTLASPTNGLVANATATGTIREDETCATPTFTALTVDVPGSATGPVVVNTSSGVLSLSIPPGAVRVGGQPVDYRLTLSPTTAPSGRVDGTYVPLRAFRVTVTAAGQTITELAQPIQATVVYTAAELACAGVTDTNLAVLRSADGQTGWSPFGLTMPDRGAGTLVVPVQLTGTMVFSAPLNRVLLQFTPQHAPLVAATRGDARR